VRARLTSRIAAPGAEAGFTIVEMVVAALILSVGALTTFGLLSTATKNTQRAKATQVAQNRVQQELEAIRGLTNDQLAMTATPAHSSNPLNPNYRVSNGTFALIRNPPGSYANMVVNSGSLYGGGFVEGGIVDPGPTPFASGDVTGKIYRYVVWRNDDECGESCPGEQDYKQVVVAVKLDTPGNQSGERGYVEVGSNFVDPTDSADNDPAPGSDGKVVTAQQFFLSDTPCGAIPPTARQAIAGDHLLHNTVGTCADGPQTGSSQGAPDTLLTGGPPDPDPLDQLNPPLYDYSDDFYLEPTPDTDKGLQILRDDTSGCYYVPTGTSNPESQIHRWVTDPMTDEFKMTETVTLEFYTRSLNDSLHTGTLCVYLYKRHEEGSPLVATDTRLTKKSTSDPYWTYTPEGNGFWPRNLWTKVRLTMAFNEAPYTIPAGDRLGVALSVDPANTAPADALPIMYDHPNYATRLEVDTSTPIDGG
jgi:type II secretory pathway pseudopilin PulG